MNFFVEYSDKIARKEIIYISHEHSMLMEPHNYWVDFTILIKYLNLNVLDGKVIDISGFFPSKEWIDSQVTPPQATHGNLIVKGDFVPDISYRMGEENIPVYYNSKTHWVCVGDPEAKGQCVEFIRNCIAVVDDEHKLKSLWMHFDVTTDETYFNHNEKATQMFNDGIESYGSSPHDVKFSIDLHPATIHKKLIFYPEDNSLSTLPRLKYSDFIIPLNQILLSVVGNIVVDIGGNIERKSIKLHHFITPTPNHGELKIINSPQHEQFITMSQYIWPTFYNPETEWICIGDPLKEGKAVEFISNCIAIIDPTGKLQSLWLNPTDFHDEFSQKPFQRKLPITIIEKLKPESGYPK